jgi:hypothetical protein
MIKLDFLFMGTAKTKMLEFGMYYFIDIILRSSSLPKYMYEWKPEMWAIK